MTGKKLCVMGSSHVASLKMAWDRIAAEHPDTGVTFFAHRGTGLSALKPIRGQLVPTNEKLRQAMRHTSGGLGRIEVSDYSAFLLYGIGIFPRKLPAGAYSRAAVRRGFEDHVNASVAGKLIKMIREISDKPIHIGHIPLPAARVDIPPAQNREDYEAFVAAMNERLFAEIGVTLLAQPPGTVGDGFRTLKHFSVGSTRLDIGDAASGKPHPEDDVRHLNADYGVLFWQTHLPAMV